MATLPTETLGAKVGETRAASTAGGGTALTNAATRIRLPVIANGQLQLLPRNFATAVVVKFNLNPWLAIMVTRDALGTAAAPTRNSNYDQSVVAQDNNANTTVNISSLPTAANGGYIYVGSWTQFAGVVVDAGTVNAVASVLTVNYWNGGAWATTSATDGTASAGATFAQNGNVTWTLPTDWMSAHLHKTEFFENQMPWPPETSGVIPFIAEPMFWTRWQVSAALTNLASLAAMYSINKSTTYAEIPAGAGVSGAVYVGPGKGGIASVTALTDAGTANLIVNAQTDFGGVIQ